MFRNLITRAPIAFDLDAGTTALADLAPPSDVAELVRGTAGCSPFLAGLMIKEQDWLSDLWGIDPRAVLEDLLSEIGAIEGDPRVGLRQAKRRAALLVGLAEIGGIWPVMDATAAWTDLADAMLARAMDYGVARHAKGPVDGDGGLVAIAMGKMGAGELNYSSDIDLVLLFDESRYDPADYGTARAILLKAARTAMGAMSDITADGYVFRTDLRLRPDPASTPIVLSMEAAERYYEAMGRTWERVAWIKARACAGAIDAGERFLERLTPFVWRRHLDFAVVEEAFDMRRRIRDHKGLTGAWDIPGHDVKLGQGGIREIEFLTQTQQIIAGGRDPSLRVRGTLDGLDRLVDAGWVKSDDRNVLVREYCHLRAVEHRIQMVQDAQTHRLPKDADGLRRIACFMGQDDADAFVADLRARMKAVEAITDPSFRPPDVDVPQGELIEGADAVTDRWTSYPALRSRRAREIFGRVRPGLLAALSTAARPSEALAAFDGFLRGLPAGVQVFSLFEANPKLVELLADICATAPDLANYLSRNAGVFDAVIAGDFLEPLPDIWDLPPVRGDFEEQLRTLRHWHREAHFRIGVHLLRGLITPEAAGPAYALLARSVLTVAWVAAETETARRYGQVPGLRLAGLGMGSLGVGRLTARSDLDMVILHDGAEEGAVSDGRRSLGAAQWATKFTQVLITALSAPTGEGRLYELDMRLRPSGRQGMVATPLSGFRSYQTGEAWVWEHMALTRARAVVGDPQLRQDAEDVRCDVIKDSRYSDDEMLSQFAEMRARLLAAGRVGGGLSVKAGPGRMQDIELAAQAHALMAGSKARGLAEQLQIAGWLTPEARIQLTEVHRLLSSVQQLVKLLTDDDPPGTLGIGGGNFIARTLHMEFPSEVISACDAAAAKAAAAIDTALDGITEAG
ncbi:glutamate-ammonia-ligase adenylyltransferase [Jannaschia faecimaris]|uniref:Glutamate-ammonia-ligase adenylyltransferase n=1 Tax=Jannaschia faecimaris TaxID=1244108 RepID=A0A1H3NUR5_9RHOB|nr:hypothetical protein [Jannaschia faecimaris]SDY92548.1 glutamate-ammonia-ligase adenylyltransferase [Jannaschia faecimaris]